MNKKVLKVMIGLVIAFLISNYILKFFFPKEFVMLIENERIVEIGTFIGERPWLQEFCDIILTFITYWLYIGATTQKPSLTCKEFLYVALAIAITHTAYYFDADLCAGLSVAFMIIIPALSDARLRPVAVVFSIHSLSQKLATSIRSLPMLLTNVNYITIVLMTLECYFWLLLVYLLYNLKKEEKHNEHTTIW